MNEKLILKWNETVQPNDEVWHLGDFALCTLIDAHSIRSRLNGKIHIIWGNHDKVAKNMKNTWNSYHDYFELKVQGYPTIVLCHYAFRVWNKAHHGSWHLYGHSHGSLPDDPNLLSFDTGVDCHNFRPISIEEVQKIMSIKTFKPVDHHKITSSLSKLGAYYGISQDLALD
jgi:calcineurin-like phosphoesterase family protein